jgi:hypothetical protein
VRTGGTLDRWNQQWQMLRSNDFVDEMVPKIA